MKTNGFLDVLLATALVRAAQISPDGKWVAWTWWRKTNVAAVYVMPLDQSSPPRRLTSFGQDTYVTSWTADSSHLIVENDCDGDERTRLFLVAIDKPFAYRRLTHSKPDTFLRGGQLHPNGKWLVYAANTEPGTMVVLRRDIESGHTQVLARPLRTPERTTVNQPSMNRQGTHVIYYSADTNVAGQQVYLVDIHGRKARKIIDCGPTTKVTASFCPDGKRIVFVAERKSHPHSYRRVGIYHLVNGRSRYLLDDPAINVESAFMPPGSDKVVIGVVRNAKPQCFLLDVTTGKRQAFPENLRLLGVGANSGEYIACQHGATIPDRLVRVTGNSIMPLTGMQNGKLSRTKLAVAQSFNWKASDGKPMHGFVYLTDRSQANGTIVLVHGGPRERCEDRFDAQIQFFCKCGYNVFTPNYRGSTGYGLAFQESIKDSGWGTLEQEDIRTGIEALIASGFANSNRVAITGTSYGGYSSWHAITHFSTELVAAAMPICGMTDLVVDYETTRPDLRTLSEEMLGGTPTQVPQVYRQRSPINHVQRIAGGLLIVQGSRDPNVTVENLREVMRALKAAGIKHQVLEFADEGHGIFKLENERKLLLAAQRFFGKFLLP